MSVVETKLSLDLSTPKVCGGASVAAEQDKECEEDFESGNWTCHCDCPPKYNMPLLMLLMQEVKQAKMHVISKDITLEWTKVCKRLSSTHRTFSKYAEFGGTVLRKKVLGLLTANKIRTGLNGFEFLKYSTSYDKLCLSMSLDIETAANIKMAKKLQKSDFKDSLLHFGGQLMAPAVSVPVRNVSMLQRVGKREAENEEDAQDGVYENGEPGDVVYGSRRDENGYNLHNQRRQASERHDDLGEPGCRYSTASKAACKR